MDLGRLVFGIGDRCRGWAQITEDEDGIWLSPPHAVPLGFGGPLRRASTAVRLFNADVRAVTGEFTADGVAPGWATVTGVWLGDAIRVEHQTATPPARSAPLDGAPPRGTLTSSRD